MNCGLVIHEGNHEPGSGPSDGGPSGTQNNVGQIGPDAQAARVPEVRASKLFAVLRPERLVVAPETRRPEPLRFRSGTGPHTWASALFPLRRGRTRLSGSKIFLLPHKPIQRGSDGTGASCFPGLALGGALAGPRSPRNCRRSRRRSDLATVPNEPSASAVFPIQEARSISGNFRFQDLHSTTPCRRESRSSRKKSTAARSRSRTGPASGSRVSRAAPSPRTKGPGSCRPKGRSLKAVGDHEVETTSIAFSRRGSGSDSWSTSMSLPSTASTRRAPTSWTMLVIRLRWSGRFRMSWVVEDLDGSSPDVQVVPRAEAAFGLRRVRSSPPAPAADAARSVWISFRDQATRMMVVPMSYADEYVNIPLLGTAGRPCARAGERLRWARKQTVVGAKARASPRGSQLDDAAPILYRFVRDEIKNTRTMAPGSTTASPSTRSSPRAKVPDREGPLPPVIPARAPSTDSQLGGRDRSRGRVLADPAEPRSL